MGLFRMTSWICRLISKVNGWNLNKKIVIRMNNANADEYVSIDIFFVKILSYFHFFLFHIFQMNMYAERNHAIRGEANMRFLQCPSWYRNLVNSDEDYDTIRINGVHQNGESESIFSRLYRIENVPLFTLSTNTTSDNVTSCGSCDRTLGYRCDTPDGAQFFIHTVNEIVSITSAMRPEGVDTDSESDPQW